MIKTRYLVRQDIQVAKTIADTNRDSIGFLPRMKLQEAADQNRCFVATSDEGNLAGFVVFRHRKIDNQTTLSDICVDETYRGKGIGRVLMNTLIENCHEKRREFIQLKCPESLTANQFYERIGFNLIATEEGKSRRLNVWRLPITQPELT